MVFFCSVGTVVSDWPRYVYFKNGSKLGPLVLAASLARLVGCMGSPVSGLMRPVQIPSAFSGGINGPACGSIDPSR